MGWESLTHTWHYVENWAQKRPDEEALVFETDRLSWKDFKNEMDAIAKSLLEIGVEKGDRVALLSMARTEFPTIYMASNKIGAMWLGLNPKFTLDELLYQVKDCKPSVLIAVRDFQENDLSDTLKSIMAECPFIKKLLVIGEPFEGSEGFREFIDRGRSSMDSALEERAESVSDTDDALLMYTSGSTGKPKGVVHTHRSIVENIKVEVKKFYFHEGARGLLHFPINHVAADVEIGFGAILAGGCLVFMDRFDPAESIRMIEKENLNFLGQVPVMYLLEFQQPAFRETDMGAMELFAWAGSAAPEIMVDVLSGISEKSGASLITGYGSTETCGFVTYTEKGDDREALLHTAGKIAPPFELKIVDDRRKELPDGEIGEIAVRGAFMFNRYWNKPEETAKVLDSDGWYYTSDLAFRDERGYIHITGRRTEMFKTGGENVYPREIEEVLEMHGSVLFAAVISVPDDLYQEVGWAFIMLQPGKEAEEKDLVELCRDKLANYKVPKNFFIRPGLPLLPNGKINKVALKEESLNILKKEQE